MSQGRCVNWLCLHSASLTAVLHYCSRSMLAHHQVSLHLCNCYSPASRRSFMVVFGVSMAASIRISNALGAGCPHSARRATFAALGLTMTSLAVLVAALLAARAAWVHLLTDVQPVIDATLSLMPLFVLSMMLDGAVFSLSSLLRGSGRQKVCNGSWW